MVVAPDDHLNEDIVPSASVEREPFSIAVLVGKVIVWSLPALATGGALIGGMIVSGGGVAFTFASTIFKRASSFSSVSALGSTGIGPIYFQYELLDGTELALNVLNATNKLFLLVTFTVSPALYRFGVNSG